MLQDAKKQMRKDVYSARPCHERFALKPCTHKATHTSPRRNTIVDCGYGQKTGDFGLKAAQLNSQFRDNGAIQPRVRPKPVRDGRSYSLFVVVTVQQ